MSYSGRQPTGAGHNQPAAAVCEICPSQLDRIALPYRHSFIAWIVGKDITPRQLASRLNRHLPLTSSVEVFKLDRGIFVLNFSEKDYSTLILLDYPWSIPNLCIHAVRWIPNFKPSESVVYVVDVWIRLHELPIEYYDDKILGKIAEFIGLALVKIDPVTKDRRKCKFARICVRLDLSSPLLLMIKINGFLQEIEFEGFDLLCSSCKRVLDYCLCNPSGSSRFDPYNCRARTFHETGSSSNPKQPMISSNQILGEEPQALYLDWNEWPSILVGESKRKATRASTSSVQPHLPGFVAEPIENRNKLCEVSVQEVPQSYPEAASSSTTIEVPAELEQKNLIPLIALPDCPMPISSHPDASSTATSTPEFEQNNLIPSIAFHDHPMSISLYPEATLTTIEVPVELEQTNLVPSIISNDRPMSIASSTTTVVELKQSNLIPSRDLDNHPTPSHPASVASTTIAAPAELEPKNLNLSTALAPHFVVEDKFRATETCSSTTFAVHNNQLQSSAAAVSIPAPQPIPTSEAALFYSNVMERSIVEKDITNTPFEGNGISHRPVLYTINPSISSLTVGLSENPNSVPKQNQFVINIVSSSRGGNKKMLGWKVPGRYNPNQIKGLKSVVQKYEPSIIVLFASWLSDDVVDEVQRELGFYGTYCEMPDDCNRGVWLLMFKQDVETEVFKIPLQDFASAYADTETSWQTWGPASFCDLTYPTGNTLAC